MNLPAGPVARYGAAVVAAAITLATALVVKWEPPPGDKLYVAIQPVPGDPWTICYGHTRGVHEGMRATQAQCDRWREEDIAEAMGHVSRCITHPLTPNQLGALADAAFNAGPAIVCGSTLQRKANAGDMRGACAELDRWVYAHGVRYPGLYARRTAERAICWPDFSNVRGGVL